MRSSRRPRSWPCAPVARWAKLSTTLTLLLSRVHEGVPPNPAPLPTYGGSGLQPGVDLEDKEALSALLDPDEDRPRAGL